MKQVISTHHYRWMWLLILLGGLGVFGGKQIPLPKAGAAVQGGTTPFQPVPEFAVCTGASFAPAFGSPVPVGNGPVSLAVADLNLDGDLDVVVVNQTNNTLTILLGNGSNGFTPAAGSPVTVGTVPTDVVIADFNRNGIPDVAVTNGGGSTVTILLGNGSGGFSPAAGSPITVPGNPRTLASGDFDRNGTPDLAVGCFTTGPNLTILLGNGTGSFTQAAGAPFVSGNQVSDVTIADFNLDGRPDLAAVALSSANLLVFLGNGSGSFSLAAGSPISLSNGPVNVVAGDLNRNGIPDLAVVKTGGAGNGQLVVYLGNGSGGFTEAAASPFALGVNPQGPALLDVNFDGIRDIAVLNSNNTNLMVFLGDGAGGFTQPAGSPISVGSNPQSIAVGDLNHDGKDDVVVANGRSNNLTVVRNTCTAQCNANFVPGPISPFVENTPQTMTTADFNQDGNPDFANTNSNSNSVTVELGNGSGIFTQATGSPVTTGLFPIGIVSGDWNKNGIADLAVANNGAASVTILLGNGSGGFSPAAGSPVTVGTGPNSMATTDFNLDGNPDLVVANSTAGNVSILLGNGSGGFSPAAGSPVTVGATPNFVVTADFNQDGRPDVATANFTGDSISVLLGNGSGGFTVASGSPLTGFDGATLLTTGDFDQDGKVDLAVASGGASTLTVLLGNGSGGFATATGFPVAVTGGLGSLNAGDLNQDGNLDLALVLANSMLVMLLGNGSGGFSQTILTGTGLGARQGALADFDQDGKPDLAFTISSNPGLVRVLLNTCCPVITVSPGTIPAGTAGAAYSQSFTALGGNGTVTFASTGTVPAGLSLSSAGVLSGTPTQSGTFNFTVIATDANGCTGSQVYVLDILCSTITVNPASVNPGSVGTAYQQVFTATNTTGSVTFSLTGSVPAGMSFSSSSGRLSGSPAQAGSFNFTITATDAAGCSGSRAYTLVICGVLAISPPSAANGVVGAHYSQTFTPSGGTGAVSFAFTGGLPPGLALGAQTGVLTGTPTQTGTFTFTITVSDSLQCQGSQGYTVTIDQAPVLQLSSPVYQVREGTSSVVVTVTRSGNTSVTAGVQFATSNGTAIAPGDFTATSGTLNFAAGELFKTFAVTIATDGTAEPDETVNLTLSNPTGATLGAQITALLTIVDANAASPVLTQFYPCASTSGRTIRVFGSGFVAGNTQVFFGGTRLIPGISVTVTSSTTLTVVVPSSSSGAGNINGFLTIRVNGVDATTQGLPFSTNPGDPSATFPEFILWGDMTADGTFTTADVALARAFTLAQTTLTSRQLLGADVAPLNANGSRGSGSVNAADIAFLRAVTFGQTTF